MPYIATIQQQNYKLTTEQQKRVTLGGKTHTIDWRKLASLAGEEKGSTAGGRYSLIIEGKSYEIYARRIVNADEKESYTYEVQLAGQYFEVTVEDERTKLLTGIVRAGSTSNAAKINAPMPGLVLHIPLAAGAPVNAGQTVVVLEAMKMENDLASPIDGTIKEVRVSPGQTVEQGQIMVIVEGEHIA
jgi:biotin carboxyl carrier protein